MEEDNRKVGKSVVDESMGDENFAELLEQSFVKPEHLEAGQRVRAQIIKIGSESIFLDIGGKSEGYLDRKELLDAEGSLTVKEGDTIEAYFLTSRNNDQIFTTKIGGGEAGRAHLDEAWRSGIPVEGIVEKEIKGGFEIKIAGGARGFCPFSQMGLHRVGNPADLVGQRLPFKITEFGERGRNIILSHRALLEEERRRQKESFREILQEGMTVKGTITSIRNFGAFVDIGGLEGLIPISEIGWGRVDDINEFLTVGQEVDIVALKLDWDKDRFSFSQKGAMPDPWENVEARYPEGSRHMGKVARLTNFGAFVTLENGVDGLLHISKLGAGKKIKHPGEVLAQGQDMEVKIESLDTKSKRIALAVSRSGAEDEEEDETEDLQRYTKTAPRSMGTLGDALKAKQVEKRKKNK